ncbi:MAG: hypothetical protein LBL96_07675 [Clostridiales bacterium]|nr:hypothetical protein [Clostridiales bacterium]
MSLRPIDIAAPISRSMDVIAASNNLAQRPEILQRQFADHIQREVSHNQQYVRHSNQLEDAELTDRDKSRDKRNKKDKDKKKAAIAATMSGALLDISV